MEQIRAFIAIELPDEVKANLAQIQTGLGHAPYVKWANPQGIHLTLKFLGNIPVGKVAEITGAMAEAAKSVAPFWLEVIDLGAFPNLAAPRVVWVGLSGDIEHLIELQRGIEHSLISLGFLPENRAFSPHLTLGRVRDGVPLQEKCVLGEKLSSIKIVEKSSIYVDGISLMRSKLTNKGAIYTRLSFATLGLPTAPT